MRWRGSSLAREHGVCCSPCTLVSGALLFVGELPCCVVFDVLRRRPADGPFRVNADRSMIRSAPMPSVRFLTVSTGSSASRLVIAAVTGPAGCDLEHFRVQVVLRAEPL